MDDLRYIFKRGAIFYFCYEPCYDFSKGSSTGILVHSLVITRVSLSCGEKNTTLICIYIHIRVLSVSLLTPVPKNSRRENSGGKKKKKKKKERKKRVEFNDKTSRHVSFPFQSVNEHRGCLRDAVGRQSLLLSGISHFYRRKGSPIRKRRATRRVSCASHF